MLRRMVSKQKIRQPKRKAIDDQGVEGRCVLSDSFGHVERLFDGGPLGVAVLLMMMDALTHFVVEGFSCCKKHEMGAEGAGTFKSEPTLTAAASPAD